MIGAAWKSIDQIMELQTTMPVVEVPVMKGQTMSDIESIYPLPTNGIFHKILPGLGATHGEINAPRHSIIVLPNVPVIKSKVAKHNKQNPPEREILGVHKGINADKITAYISNDKITYKKILTTPEGYKDKVRHVFKDVFTYIKCEYYLLIDECERTIQDVDFRDKITAPFDDFFSFKNKGLISATTLPFSDPEFEKEFTHYVIKPDWSYRRAIALINTNNVVATMRHYLSDKGKQPSFIFLSSIKTITALIEALEIKADSKIHCSENRKTELKLRGFKSDSELDLDGLAKFNFLTSRFYSAVDIELEYKPDVVMLTEVMFAEHSILDPQTEVIQIAGRFRNGTNTITHITNTNPEIQVKTPEQVKTYLDGQQDVFKQILTLKQTLTSKVAKDAFDEIEKSDFAKYFKPDGTYNWFMLDNAIQEARVLGLYQQIDNLTAGYKKIGKHFDVSLHNAFYPLSDADRLKRESIESRKGFVKEVVRQLKELTSTTEQYVLGAEEALSDLRRACPIAVDAYHIIGEQGIEDAGYLETKIKQAVDEHNKKEKIMGKELMEAVYQSFAIGDKPASEEITPVLQKIFDSHGVKSKARAAHIEKYFITKRSTRGIDNKKVYVLTEARYPDWYCEVHPNSPLS
jgi:hypothetical protein